MQFRHLRVLTLKRAIKKGAVVDWNGRSKVSRPPEPHFTCPTVRRFTLSSSERSGSSAVTQVCDGPCSSPHRPGNYWASTTNHYAHSIVKNSYIWTMDVRKYGILPPTPVNIFVQRRVDEVSVAGWGAQHVRLSPQSRDPQCGICRASRPTRSVHHEPDPSRPRCWERNDMGKGMWTVPANPRDSDITERTKFRLQILLSD